MLNEVEIIYSYESTCELIQLAEFLRLCGVYVYETCMDFPKWTVKTKANGIREKVCLLGKSNRIEEVMDVRNRDIIFLYSDGNKEPDAAILNHDDIIQKDSVIQWLRNIGRKNEWGSFTESFWNYYLDQELYRTLFCLRNIRKPGRLLEGARKHVSEFLKCFSQNNAEKTQVYYFAEVYLSMLCNRADEVLGREKTFDFDKLIKLCNKAENRQLTAFYELKGDIYFSFMNNYIWGLLNYEKCLEWLNYSASYKLSGYWKNIVKDIRKEEKYLRKAMEYNNESYEAAVRLGRLYEDTNRKKEAVEIYRHIIEALEEKAKVNVLFPWEFECLCTANKRIGCMTYKDPHHPDYQKAIEYYKKIFLLWNQCGANGFIQCFPEQYREELADYYRKLFDIRGVISSLAKIYNLIRDTRKSTFCWNLFQTPKWEDLKKIPLEKL